MPAALILAYVVVAGALLFRLGVTALLGLAIASGAKVDAFTIVISALVLAYWGWSALQFFQRRESGRMRCVSLALISAVFGALQVALGWRGLDLSSGISIVGVVLSAASAGVLSLPDVKREMRAA